MTLQKYLNVSRQTSNTLLLISLTCSIIIVPIVGNTPYFLTIRQIVFAMVMISTLLVADRLPNIVALIAGAAALLQWAAHYMGWSFMAEYLRLAFALLFIYTVVTIILTIARLRSISKVVIIEAVNAYLLLGLVFSLLVQLILVYDSTAYTGAQGFGTIYSDMIDHGAVIYYAFITMATVGYGDIIPLSAPARTLAIVISVSGQLYLTIIIALIMGKYVNLNSNEG